MVAEENDIAAFVTGDSIAGDKLALLLTDNVKIGLKALGLRGLYPGAEPHVDIPAELQSQQRPASRKSARDQSRQSEQRHCDSVDPSENKGTHHTQTIPRHTRILHFSTAQEISNFAWIQSKKFVINLCSRPFGPEQFH